MAYRLAVESARGVRGTLPLLSAALVALVLVLTACLSPGDEPDAKKAQDPKPVAGASVAQEPPAGPDLEAFRTAKQAYFRNPQQAADLFRDFIEKYRDSEWTPEAYYWLGKSLETAKADRAEVLKAYTHFLRRYPNHKLADEATFAIAEVYRNRRTEAEDLDRAVDRYEKFIQSFPGSDRVPEAYFRTGDVQLALKRYDKALESFGKVVSDFTQSPFAVPARMGRADCLSRLERYDEATGGYKELLKLSLTDWDELRVRLGLLNCHLKTNRIDEALAEAETIRSEADKRGHGQDRAALDSYRRVSEYYQHIKAYDKAATEMKSYIERFANSDGVWSARSSLGDIYLAAGKPANAREELSRIVNDYPRTKDKTPPDLVLSAQYRVAYSFEVEKNLPEAVARYQQLADAYPDSHRGKQAKKRAEELKKALEEKPKEQK